MTEDLSEFLTPERVLLVIGKLAEEQKRIWRGTVAKSLNNGGKVTEAMVKPHIEELVKKGYMKKKRNNDQKWQGKVREVPTLRLTLKGKEEIERIKASQYQEINFGLRFFISLTQFFLLLPA